MQQTSNLMSEVDEDPFLGYQPQKVVVKQIQTDYNESANVNFDNMLVKTDSGGSSEEANLAFQLLDGEVMDAKMANFIGIHMLNEMPQ